MADDLWSPRSPRSPSLGDNLNLDETSPMLDPNRKKRHTRFPVPLKDLTNGTDKAAKNGTTTSTSSQQALTRSRRSGLLNSLHYTFMLFILTAAGPFGIEPLIASSSPFYALLSLLIVPFTYCIPQSYMCAELSSMIPSNHGSIAWVYRGLGPFWGFLYSVNDCCSTLIDTPTYIVLIGTYSEAWLIKIFEPWMGYLFFVNPGIINYGFKLFLLLIAAVLNVFNITVVGNASIILSFLIMAPLLIGFIITLPDVNMNVWFDTQTISNCNDRSVGVCDWPLYISTVIWLHTGWDVVSHIAGEVGFDFKTVMNSFLWANVLDLLSYLLPLISVFTIAYPASNDYKLNSKWEDGYLINAYYNISPVLGGFVFFGAILSNYSIHLCEISTLAREIWALAQETAPESQSQSISDIDKIPISVLPPWIGKLYDATKSPLRAIIVITLLNCVLIIFPFEFLLELSVVQNCISFVLEYASLITLRYKEPDEPRPFKIPGGMLGVWILTLLKFGLIFLLIVMIIIQQAKIFLICVVFNICMVIYYRLIVRKKYQTIIEKHRVIRDSNETVFLD